MNFSEKAIGYEHFLSKLQPSLDDHLSIKKFKDAQVWIIFIDGICRLHE